MSYREEGDSVILTMSREDYEKVMMVFYAFTAPAMASVLGGLDKVLDFLNRLNQGNPNYTPYQTGEKS